MNRLGAFLLAALGCCTTLSAGLYPKDGYVYFGNPTSFPVTGKLSGTISLASDPNYPSPVMDESISYEVKIEGDKIRYTYTLSNLQRGLSHFTFNISNEETLISELTAVSGNQSILGLTSELGELSEPTGTNGPLYYFNDGFRQNVLGAADATDAVISFLSTSLPVLGSFYAKSGTGGLYSSGLNAEDYDDNLDGFLDEEWDGTDADALARFIAVPDTKKLGQQDVVPEPISVASWIGLMGVGGLVARRRNRK